MYTTTNIAGPFADLPWATGQARLAPSVGETRSVAAGAAH